MRNILITGAAGKIGDALRKGLRKSYRGQLETYRKHTSGRSLARDPAFTVALAIAGMGVCTENLNPHIMAMKAAKNWM